jgi:hypothetical protein
MLSKREKELLDKEVELYKREKMLQVEIDANAKINEANLRMSTYRKQIEELAIKCADDTAKNEHEFHSKQQGLGIELAKLEALKETMQNDVTTYKKLLAEKDLEIVRLHNLVNKLIDKSPQTIVQQSVKQQ